MRSLLVVSCASLLLHVGCGVDPTTAAGGLKAAPSQPKAQSRKAGAQPIEPLLPTSTAKKTDDEQQKPKTPPKADFPTFDGVEGEAQDKDHKGASPVELDGIDGESQDKDHGKEIDVLETTQRVAH